MSEGRLLPTELGSWNKFRPTDYKIVRQKIITEIFQDYLYARSYWLLVIVTYEHRILLVETSLLV